MCIRDRYESKLHTEVHLQNEINKVLINSEFKIEFKEKIINLKNGLDRFLKAISNDLKLELSLIHI